MRRALLALTASAFLSACATQNTSTPNELYPYQAGSMGNPNAKATVLTGVAVVLLTAALVHSIRDK